VLEYSKSLLLIIACLFILLTLFKLRRKDIPRIVYGFLLSSLFLTLFLVIIIEIKPHHFLRNTFSISNLITYFFYFALVSLYFIKNAKIIIQNKYLLIITTFILFGLANAVDLLSDGQLFEFSYSEIIEDIFHILGIVYWLLFFVDYSRRIKIKYL
jgi:hypothetical protein